MKTILFCFGCLCLTACAPSALPEGTDAGASDDAMPTCSHVGDPCCNVATPFCTGETVCRGNVCVMPVPDLWTAGCAAFDGSSCPPPSCIASGDACKIDSDCCSGTCGSPAALSGYCK